MNKGYVYKDEYVYEWVGLEANNVVELAYKLNKLAKNKLVVDVVGTGELSVLVAIGKTLL